MAEPLWLSVARMVVGVREIPGPQSHPLILNWARDISAPGWYDNDDKPWCAIPVNRVLLACQMPMCRHADPLKRDGFDLLRAATFETYGVSLSEPSLGCFLVFIRPGGNHVGWYLGEDATHYCVLGGNQGNAMGITWIVKERCSATRWPAGVPLPTTGRVALTRVGVVSTNED